MPGLMVAGRGGAQYPAKCNRAKEDRHPQPSSSARSEHRSLISCPCHLVTSSRRRAKPRRECLAAQREAPLAKAGIPGHNTQPPPPPFSPKGITKPPPPAGGFGAPPPLFMGGGGGC